MICRTAATRTSYRPLAAAVASVFALLALTACGATHVGAGGTGTTATAAVASPTAPAPAPVDTAAKAAHDKAFPDVAARCDEARRTPPPDGPAKSEPRPSDSEAAKYAENHAFKRQARLSSEARCRGEAHAQRIRKALTGPGAKSPANEADLAAALVRLGYEVDSGSVHRIGGTLGFSSFVPGTGPCVTGRLGSPATFETHGVYLEGGCTKPQGGH
ncbi:hypothetical protein [Streptomyces cremeus]|uniref:Lipoprotein n=1 Tax=Streptomyces cremeus TaxID=66881 RepID=A0ABV5PDR1_STRCM